MAQGDGLFEAGILKQGGSNKPGWVNNVAIVNATTTDANDSIGIRTAAHGSFALASDVGSVTINHQTTAGKLANLFISANVTIKLTGAHWGYGTLGDLVDQELYVYAINDTGSLKWGVSVYGGLTTILNTNSSATGTSVTLRNHMLVNTTLASGTWPVQLVGRFLADFDDTGGAAEDLWAVQSGIGEIVTTSEAARTFIQVFSASGTYVKPLGLRKLLVIVTGGGGGGGGCIDDGAGTAAAGGGGGGGTAIEWIDGQSIAATQTVTIGAAGTAGTSGTSGAAGAGGTSSFGSFCSATGGGAGIADNTNSSDDRVTSAGGAGGVGSGGTLNLPGSLGLAGITLSTGVSKAGNGGGSFWGGGGLGNTSGGAGVAPAGANSGAGGGGGCVDSATDRDGAAGAAGVVVVMEFF